MDKAPPETDVKKPPPRRRRPLILYVMIAVSLSSVLGPVLLSRDMQHLRRLAAKLGIDAPGWMSPTPEKLVFQGPPRPSNKILVNRQFMRPPELNIATAFRRVWQLTGPDMCKALKAAGIEPTPWQPAVIGGNTFECSYDKVYRKDKDKVGSSLFVIVRGNQQGTISSMRVKLVDPARGPDGSLDPQLLKIFGTMLTQSRWGDFTAELEAIRTLKDVKKDGFGAVMRFSHEYSDEKSFNFILNLQALTPEQKRSSVLFSQGTWFEGAHQEMPPAEGMGQDPLQSGPLGQGFNAPPPAADTGITPLPKTPDEPLPEMPDAIPTQTEERPADPASDPSARFPDPSHRRDETPDDPRNPYRHRIERPAR